jgi:peptidoglycan hydrolase-like protein with peptidoglycan-binding domain
MILSVKQRQKYLKFLGFYNGNIDGINGKLTKNAVFKLLKAAFLVFI